MELHKIKELADKKGKQIKDLIEETGIKKGTLFNYLKGKTPITLEAFLKISEVLQVSSLELLSFVQNIELDAKAAQFLEKIGPNKDIAQKVPENVNVMMIPLVNQYAYAGYLGGFEDESYVEELPKIPYLADREYKGNYVFFEVKGDSMDNASYESYLEGDLILCRDVRQDFWMSKLHINKWDFVIVHKTEGILLKRITDHNVEEGVLTLHSLNEYYEDSKVHIKDIAKIFNVVDVRRNKSRR
ncbi:MULTISPECIES: LexA family transcriptional regulator [Aquimarina]|uniref:Helix-turn-helix domain-containing protein n=1 Tax=Aquimarina algiphila TaxID=2047982 RepID=A0A554VP85_9FLAO|nr:MULTISPECIES: helix-turn-helix domain-containing protein [Aquimarina]TSE10220.1 helix-turn-helix domain-containing protein [Aquimarina algiphila]